MPRFQSSSVRRLVIDDERTHLGGGVHARTSAAGLARLQDGWDEIYLDHDLGPDDDAMVVVDRLYELAYAGEALLLDRIFVHTQNPVGAQNIISAPAL